MLDKPALGEKLNSELRKESFPANILGLFQGVARSCIALLETESMETFTPLTLCVSLLECIWRNGIWYRNEMAFGFDN